MSLRQNFFFLLLFSISLSACSLHRRPVVQPVALAVEAAGKDSEWISKWQILGPFSSAPQEADIDHLLDFGGEAKISPSAEQDFQSALSKEGKVHWSDLLATSSEVNPTFPNVNWELYQKSAGIAGIANVVYAAGEIQSDSDRVVLAQIKGVRDFYVNGVHFFGQSYAYDYFRVPIALTAGMNKIILKIVGLGEPKFTFRISTSANRIEIPDDITQSDLVRTHLNENFWLSVPLFNMTLDWQKNLKVKVSSPDQLFADVEVPVPFTLAPLSILKVPVLLKQIADVPALAKDSKLQIKVVSEKEETLAEKSEPLAVKDQSNPHSISFYSQIDHSVQYYSVIYPKNFDPAKKDYSLIFSLHGANVEASIQTETYVPKDWAFVVAPTNRRPHGFAWQDIGRLDALEVLNTALKSFKIDASKVYLAGHSMGGQGVWHIGLHYPDYFAGLSPAAGWSSFQTYSPFTLQNSAFQAPPEIMEFRDRALMDANNPYFLKNAEGLPIFITQAERDEVVPPYHSRLFNQLAHALDMRVEYREIDSDVHWCPEPKIDGVGYNCVDHPHQYEFFQEHPPLRNPKKIERKIFDLEVNSRAGWLTVLEQFQKVSPTELKAEIKGKDLILETKNIRAVEIDRATFSGKNVKVNWNGSQSVFPLAKGNLRLEISDKNKLVKSKAKASTPTASFASLKSVFFHPYLLVYGTSGKSEETAANFALARDFNNRAWANANSSAPIFSDRDILPADLKNDNVILIGDQFNNSLIARVKAQLPVRLERESAGLWDLKSKIQVAKIPGRNLGANFVYTSPWNPQKLIGVFSGSTKFQPSADRLGSGAPDFVIFNDKVLTEAWGGVLSAGYFSPRGDLSNHDYFLR